VIGKPSVRPREQPSLYVELLKLSAFVGAVAAAAVYFEVGKAPVIAFLMFTLLLLAYNVVQFLVALVFGVRATEFGLYVGFPVARFQVGPTTVRLNWIPLGSYVGFNPAPPLPGASSDQLYRAGRPTTGFTQLHPARRALIAVSGPVLMAVVALVLLSPDGIAGFVRDVVAEIAARAKSQPGPMPFRSFLSQFAHPLGIARGTGQVAALLAMVNLLPVPATSGGFAAGELLSWVRRGRSVPVTGDRA